MHRIFDLYGAHANEEHKTIKAAASELLELYAMLRFWVETRLPSGDCRIKSAVDAFLACCKVLDIMLFAKRRLLSTRDASMRLRTALATYMRLHKAAQGDSNVRPKHHWAFDVAEQLGNNDGVVFDAFVIERLHLRVKAVSENVKNTKTFERSVLSGVVNSHVRSANQKWIGGGLVGAAVQHPIVQESLVADHVELAGVRVAVGDVVCCGERMGQVVACVTYESGLLLVVDAWRLAQRLSQHSSKWQTIGAQRCAWQVAEAEECIAWKKEADGYTTVIRV